MFALTCEHVQFLQDFIVWPKCPQTETTQTKMAQTEKLRSWGHIFYVIQLQKWYVD